MGTTERAFESDFDTKSSIPERLPLQDFMRGTSYDVNSNALTYEEGEPKTAPVEVIRSPPHVIRPRLEQLLGNFRLIQLWEGHVLEVTEKEFVAVITDCTNPNFNDEQVTLGIEELTEDDIPLIKPGAVFYWSIGYADYPGRPRVRQSRIRFRRLPAWTQAELEHAREAAKRLSTFFVTD